LGPAKAEQAEGNPARRPGSGRVAKIALQVTGQHVGEIQQPFFQRHNVLRIRTLLRAEDVRRATRPEQRILHIARRHDLRQFDGILVLHPDQRQEIARIGSRSSPSLVRNS